jgi:hypothetical protein
VVAGGLGDACGTGGGAGAGAVTADGAGGQRGAAAGRLRSGREAAEGRWRRLLAGNGVGGPGSAMGRSASALWGRFNGMLGGCEPGWRVGRVISTAP